MARARARRKIAELEAALEGAEFFTAEHAAVLARMLARIDRVNAGIDELTDVIERLLAPSESTGLGGVGWPRNVSASVLGGLVWWAGTGAAARKACASVLPGRRPCRGAFLRVHRAG